MSRTTVKTPSTNTDGSTVATNGTNTSRDRDANPIATSALESVMTNSDVRAAASLIVPFAAVCSTKCSVVSRESNAVRRAASSSVAIASEWSGHAA